MYRVREQIGCTDAIMSKANAVCNIAILDTGIAVHPDLKDHILDFQDFINHKTGIYDEKGHGTHVCGIACGSGKLSGGRYKGIAPGAGILVGKVLDYNGNGSVFHMIDGIDWVIKNKNRFSIRVLNISVGLGGSMSERKEKILLEKLMEAVESGIIVVCAAGNTGPAVNTISNIGRCKDFLTVGCHDGLYFKKKSGRCETYSARGGEHDKYIKPDLVAPGTDIISCNNRIIRSRGTYIDAYIKKSGTSMAAPIVSGAIALILQCCPDWDNKTVVRKVLLSAEDLKEPLNKQGYGMINVKKVLTGLV